MMTTIQKDIAGAGTGGRKVQHGIGKSILLHLLPGAALTAFILLAAPVVTSWGFPPVFALFVGIALVIVPIELGILFAHARRTTGSYSLKETVLYRERLPSKRLIPMTIGLVLWFVVLLALATAVADEWIAERFFSWIPDAIRQFSVVEADSGSAPGYVIPVMIAIAVVVNGFVGPITEELYFRGYLLPRIDRLGKWAPVVNTALFSIYHFWTPWQNLTRIIGFLPITWTSWRLRSTQIAMAAHVTVNLVFLLGMLALFLGDR